jgi:hypothetical protein
LAARNVLLRMNKQDPQTLPTCVLVDMGLARLYDREDIYLKTKTAALPLKWSAPGLCFVPFCFLSNLLTFAFLREMVRITSGKEIQ